MRLPAIDGSNKRQIHRRRLLAGLPLLMFQFALAQAIAPATAQISIQGDDGKVVRIGPGGIEVHSSRGNTVTVTPGAINVRKPATTQTKKTVVIKSPAVSPLDPAPNLMDMLAKLETAAYGKINTSKPLIARLEQLETDNLGKKGTGSNIQRAQALAKVLGVTFATTTSGTIEVKTKSPREHAIIDTGTAAARPVETLLINDNHHQGKFKCNNSNVSITSNNCKLTLTGTCSDLSISGNHNVITAERISAIQLLGNHNTVTWTKEPAPAVSNVGNYNKIMEDDPND